MTPTECRQVSETRENKVSPSHFEGIPSRTRFRFSHVFDSNSLSHLPTASGNATIFFPGSPAAKWRPRASNRRAERRHATPYTAPTKRRARIAPVDVEVRTRARIPCPVTLLPVAITAPQGRCLKSNCRQGASAGSGYGPSAKPVSTGRTARRGSPPSLDSGMLPVVNRQSHRCKARSLVTTSISGASPAFRISMRDCADCPKGWLALNARAAHDLRRIVRVRDLSELFEFAARSFPGVYVCSRNRHSWRFSH